MREAVFSLQHPDVVKNFLILLRFRLAPEPLLFFMWCFSLFFWCFVLCDLGCKLLKINLLKCWIFSNLELDINKIHCYEERI